MCCGILPIKYHKVFKTHLFTVLVENATFSNPLKNKFDLKKVHFKFQAVINIQKEKSILICLEPKLNWIKKSN